MAHNEDGTAANRTDADELENTAKASKKADSKAADSAASKTASSADTSADDERDPEEVSVEEVQNVLNKKANSKDLPKNVQKILTREAESSKRVADTIKKSKSNPGWLVPLFSALLIIGLAWVVITYITGKYPIPGIGNWNLLIGFAIMMVGFLMTMFWN